MNKTLFQKIADKEIPAQIIYEDKFCVCFHDITPQAPIHLLLIPRNPIPRIGEARPHDAPLLGHLMSCIAPIAEKVGIASTGYRVVINNGKDAGEAVPHLHIHLLGGRPLEWPPG